MTAYNVQLQELVGKKVVVYTVGYTPLGGDLARFDDDFIHLVSYDKRETHVVRQHIVAITEMVER